MAVSRWSEGRGEFERVVLGWAEGGGDGVGVLKVIPRGRGGGNGKVASQCDPEHTEAGQQTFGVRDDGRMNEFAEALSSGTGLMATMSRRRTARRPALSSTSPKVILGSGSATIPAPSGWTVAPQPWTGSCTGRFSYGDQP